jgi:hypothetical protein
MDKVPRCVRPGGAAPLALLELAAFKSAAMMIWDGSRHSLYELRVFPAVAVLHFKVTRATIQQRGN